MDSATTSCMSLSRSQKSGREKLPMRSQFHRSCELRRPDSKQRPPGAILGAASVSPRHFRGFARSTNPPRGWTAFALSLLARGERGTESV